MKCDQVQPDLLDYAKGLLNGPESEGIEAHLKQCAECAALLEEETAFCRKLAALPQEAPANDVWTLVRARTKPRRLRPMAWLRGLMATGMRRAVAVAVTASVAAVGFYGLKATEQPAESLKPIERSAVTVKWSDDPLGKHADAMINVIDEM